MAFFFFWHRRRQLSHLHFSQPIWERKQNKTKQQNNKPRKQRNQSALSHYLQFSHLMVFFWTWLFFCIFFCFCFCFIPKIWPCIQKRLTAHYFGYTCRQHFNHFFFVKSQPLWLCYVSDDINIGRHSGNIVAF